MWHFILNNKEWIFSGIGATVLTIAFSIYVERKKKSRNSDTLRQSSENSNFIDSPFTNLQGHNINYSQNVFQSNVQDSLQEELKIPIKAEDLSKSKKDYLFQKANLRKFIYRIIEPAKKSSNIIQIKHVVDAAEDKLKLSYKPILEELNEMEDEGLIFFVYEKPVDKGSPYNVIKLTKKFFATIKD